MLDSFITGALTSLVVSLIVLGWKFFKKNNPSNKVLITRIIICSCLVALNIFIVLFSLFSIGNFDDTNYTMAMIFSAIIYSIPLIILIRFLIKDSFLFIERKKSNQHENISKTNYNNDKSSIKTQNNQNLSLSNNRDYNLNFKPEKYLDDGIYPITDFVTKEKLSKNLLKIKVVIGTFYKSSYNKLTYELCINDYDNTSKKVLLTAINKYINIIRDINEAENKKEEIMQVNNSKNIQYKKKVSESKNQERYHIANSNKINSLTNFPVKPIIITAVISIIFIIIHALYLIIPLLNTRSKNETLANDELELVGTYFFAGATYHEIYLNQSIDCQYPNGPTYFNKATEQYLDTKIELKNEKKDGQISGSFITPSSTYDFTWIHSAPAVITLNTNLSFQCGNDISITNQGTDFIFISDDGSTLTIELSSSNYIVFYYFDKKIY